MHSTFHLLVPSTASSPPQTQMAAWLQGLTFTSSELYFPIRTCRPDATLPLNVSVVVTDMFPTKSDCHGDYGLTAILIRLPANPTFLNPPNVHENAQNDHFADVCLKNEKSEHTHGHVAPCRCAPSPSFPVPSPGDDHDAAVSVCLARR